MESLKGDGPPLNERGARGFEVLGSQASPAIAELKRIVADPKANSDGAAGGAMYALSCIGEPAFPTLKAMIKDSRSAIREQAIICIAFPSRLGTNTMAAVLLLCEALEDADRRVAAMAAHCLNQFPEQADITIPALTRGLTNSDRLIKQRCVTTLSTYRNRAKAAVPELTAMLHDSDFTIRVIVTNALKQIAPEVLTNGVSK
jgi:HEAT repeat protein